MKSLTSLERALVAAVDLVLRDQGSDKPSSDARLRDTLGLDMATLRERAATAARKQRASRARKG